MEHHVVVRSCLRALVVIAAGRRLVLLATDPERTRHTGMHERHVARGEVSQEVFGAAAEPSDGRAFEPRYEVLRQRPAQITAPRLNLVEARALHGGLEVAPHRLDFGEFG